MLDMPIATSALEKKINLYPFIRVLDKAVTHHEEEVPPLGFELKIQIVAFPAFLTVSY